MARFRLTGIDPAEFAPLFALTDDQLRRHGAVRRVADDSPGFPCRVSLADAAVGETLLLLPFEHQPAASPYRASGPVFVREHAVRAALAVDEVPPYVARRLISLRAYDEADLMIDASVHDGARVAAELHRLFDDPRIAYVHLHNAKQGCFSCRADRVEVS